MFGVKTAQPVQLELFLQTRRERANPRRLRLALGVGSGASFLASAIATSNLSPMSLVQSHAIEAVVGIGLALGVAAMSVKVPKGTAGDVQDQANAVAATMRGLAAHRRLTRALHPGTLATLDECAGSWRRVQGALQSKAWRSPTLPPHWINLRDASLEAAELAMSEAIVLAGQDLLIRAPRSRAAEVVDEVMETVLGRTTRTSEPLPPTFPELRGLAEKLRSVAVQVEGATYQIESSEPLERQPDASQRLDEVLSQLKNIQVAEDELRKDLRH